MRKPMGLIAVSLVLSSPVDASAMMTFQDADYNLLMQINRRSQPSLDATTLVLSNKVLLVGMPWIPALALSGGQWQVPVRLAETQAVSAALSVGGKLLIDRPRPYFTHPEVHLSHGEEILSSMPSTQAAVSFAGAAVIADAFPALAVPAYGWATLVSLSRIYDGVHYPSDVAVGAILGLGSFHLTRWALGGVGDAWKQPTSASLKAGNSAAGLIPVLGWSFAF